MCQCPQPLQPPNTTIRNCRYILQGLAVGLLILSIFSIFNGDIINMIYFLMFIYLLFISWTQFNWCTTLFFFLFSWMQLIFSTIVLIGIITHGNFFDHEYEIVSTQVLLQVIFFSTAIFFSHYAYKHFKHLGMDGMGVMVQRVNANPNDYQRFEEQRQRQNGGQERQRQKEQKGDEGKYFHGEGVRLD